MRWTWKNSNESRHSLGYAFERDLNELGISSKTEAVEWCKAIVTDDQICGQGGYNIAPGKIVIDVDYIKYIFVLA